MNETLSSSIFSTFKNLLRNAGKTGEETLDKLPSKTIKRKLFLTSFLILFFELACIRWLPAHITHLGFFINFVLMAVFLGTGIGILLSKKENIWWPPFSLSWLVLFILVSRFDFELKIPSNDVLYYGASEGATSFSNFLVLPFVFVLVVIMVAPLGRLLGRLLVSLPPLEAYGIDILGSLAGIATFFLMSYLAIQPVVWFGLTIILYISIAKKKELFLSAPLFIAVLYISWALSTDSYWSPYYRIQSYPNDHGGISITVNKIGHQGITNLENKANFYYQVYDSFSPRTFDDVLVIGAGSGMDVALTLHEGAKKVDAVEIDPVLYQLGLEHNHLKPYQDARVHRFIDDGRAFLRNTENKYDLIIFALPDSLTLVSGYSNLRLESFLFTKEAFVSARAALKDDGVLVLYNFYREDWFIEKLAYTLTDVFDEAPYIVTYGQARSAATLIAASDLASINPDLDTPYQTGSLPINSDRGYRLPVTGSGRLTLTKQYDMSTDDWPFMYMPRRSLPEIYLVAIAFALATAGVFYAVAQPKKAKLKFNWHFFALGIAFMLLETRSLVTFALLFGSTWIVNSLVFFAILLSVLVAIRVNQKIKIENPTWLYVGLLLSILANYWIPQEALLSMENPVLRYSMAGFIAFLPIFLANVVFSHSFKNSDQADIAFGSNLLGAFIGGILEYSALVLGYHALLVIVLIVYVAAFLTRREVEDQ